MNRPTPVTVFGVLNIIFGGLGLLSAPFAIMALMVVDNTMRNPVLEIARRNPVVGGWMMLSNALGVLAAIVLLAGGIGLLQLKPWGRKLSIGFAVYALVMGVIGMLITGIYIVPALLSQPQANSAEAAGAVGGAIGGLVGGLVGLVYPLLLLIFMGRPAVVAAFKRQRMDSV